MGMDGNAIGSLVALAGFAVTFLLARTLSSALRKRREARAKAEALRTQSRQVRRAQERRNKR